MTKEIIINGRFLTGPLTGVQRVAFELLKALDTAIIIGDISTKGMSFTVLYSGILRHPVEFQHIRLQQRGRLTGNAWEQLELPLYARGKLLVNLCSIAPIFKRRQIVMIHDASFLVNKAYFSKAFRNWYGFAIPLIGKISRQIVTVSEFSKRELALHAGIPGRKTAVIYNSGEHVLGFDEPDEAFKALIDSCRPYCLAVSSLAANKNFGGLSRALQQVDLAGHRLLIAGGKIGVLKNGHDESNATYLGYVSDAELGYLYRNASLFLFPSFYEGFGIPPLEAMAMGCPVLSSNTSAMPEVLRDAVLYFNPYDLNDMGNKTSALLRDTEKLSALAMQGKQQANNYKWVDSARKLFDLIVRHHG